MTHVWKRPCDCEDCPLGENCFEYAETEDLNPPELDGGWYLDSKFGVGRVKGAGDSPSRSS